MAPNRTELLTIEENGYRLKRTEGLWIEQYAYRQNIMAIDRIKWLSIEQT